MRTLIVSLVVLVAPTAARAQVCPYGLVAVDAAHCCWPGQAFAPDRGTCTGAPQCPPGLAPYGETCIVADGAAPPQGQPLPPPPMPAGTSAAPPMQPMPQVFGYPVRFEAKDGGEEYTVSLDKGVACRVPCDMTVPPGRHRVRIEGDAKFHQDLNFPASPTTVHIERRKGGRAALGIVGLAVGIPAAVVGGVVGLVGLLGNNVNDGSLSRRSTYSTLMYAGFGVAAAGVTLAAVGAGVGFGTAGKNRVRFGRASVDEPAEAPVQLLGLGAAPIRGGGVVGATFAF